MGWMFAAETHGQGIAGEACQAAIAWAEANLQPSPIWAIIAPANVAMPLTGKSSSCTISLPIWDSTLRFTKARRTAGVPGLALKC